MPLHHVRHELEMMLAQAKEQVGDAERKRAAGDYRDKVDAAGELALLIPQRQLIEDRLRAVARIETATDSLMTIVREEIFNLGLRFRQFLTGSGHHA